MENLNEKKQIEEMAKVIKTSLDGLGCGNFNFTGEEISTMFAKALYTAGYRKQSEGEWTSNRQTGEYICSLCGGIAPVDCKKEDFYKSNYCPNCGAKMKGD